MAKLGTNSMIFKLSSDTLTAGMQWTPKLDAIAAAVGMFQAPCVRRFGIRLNLTYSTGTAGGPSAQILDFLTSVVVKDRTSERMNLASGISLRHLMHTEYGVNYRDGVNIAASQGSANATDKTFWLPFIPRGCLRPADFYIPATDIYTGWLSCKFGSTFGATNTFTYTSGNVDTIVEIVEEGSYEAKSRLVWKDITANSNNFTYSLDGALYAAYYQNGATNFKAGTTIAAQIITSVQLQQNQIDSSTMRDLYEINRGLRFSDGTISAGTLTAATETADPVASKFLLPIFVREEFCAMSDLPVLTALQYQTSGTVTPATDLITMGWVQGRSAMHTAQQLRVNAGNIGAILSKGYVNASNGRDIPVRAFGDFMSDPMNPVWRLPVKLPADVSAANRFNY